MGLFKRTRKVTDTQEVTYVDAEQRVRLNYPMSFRYDGPEAEAEAKAEREFWGRFSKATVEGPATENGKTFYTLKVEEKERKSNDRAE